MQYEVEMITYYDHSRKTYDYDEGWLKRATKDTLTLTSIGAVVFENAQKVVLSFSFSTEKVEMDEILKYVIIERKKLGKVELEMIE